MYLLSENNRCARIKCYSSDDGKRLGCEIFSNGKLYRPQKATKFTCFITQKEFENIVIGCKIDIKIYSLIPFGNLLPFEIVSDRVDFDIKNGVLSINNFGELRNGRDYHFGHAILTESIKWTEDSGDKEFDLYAVSSNCVWKNRYKSGSMEV